MKIRVKKFNVLIRIALFCLLTVALLNGDSHALMLKINKMDLVHNADLIVTGTVQSMSSSWNESQDYIYTEVVISVQKVHNGNASLEEVLIIVPGGEVGDITQRVSTAPVFSVGEETLLFLQYCSGMDEFAESGVNFSYYTQPALTVYGKFQGKKEIIDDRIDGILLPDYEFLIKSIQKGISWSEYQHLLAIIGGTETSNFTDDSEDKNQIVVNPSGYILNGQQWPRSAIPVGYRVNTSGGPSGSLTAIQNAARTWNNAGANFSFRYDGTHTRSGTARNNNVNEVMFFNSGASSTLAEATWWFYESTGNIVEADIQFNTAHSWNTTGSQYDLETVALHEFGHWLSLGHSTVQGAIMWWQYKGMQRTLHSDDISAIRAIYGSTTSSRPSAPTLSSPSANANVSGTSVIFRWNSSTGATDYFLELNTSSSWGSGTQAYFKSVGNRTSIELTGFPNNGTTYHWRVWAGNSAGWSAASTSRSFRNGGSTTSRPSAPTLSSPSANANVSGTSVIFRWNSSTGATDYRLELNTSSSWSSGTRAYYATVGNRTSIELTGFPNNGTTYYWRVWAGNSAGWSAASTSRSFRNGGSTAATHTLTVESSGAASVPITGNPSTYTGTTKYTRSNISNNTSITLTAPEIRGTVGFASWSGCDSRDVAKRTCTVRMSTSKTVTVNYARLGMCQVQYLVIYPYVYTYWRTFPNKTQQWCNDFAGSFPREWTPN